MAGMRDIAQLAGVSLSTVSVVLGNSGKYVSKDIADRVHAAADQLNYKRPVRNNFTQKTVAVVLSSATSVFFANVLDGIEATLAEGRHMMLYYNSDFNFEKEKSCIHTLKKQSLAGIILDSVCPISEENDYLDWLHESFGAHGVPIVFLERRVRRDGFYSIFLDNYKYAYEATAHLIAKGHTCIGHIKGNSSVQLAEDRLLGYHQALKDYGLCSRNELVQYGDFSSYSGYMAAQKLMNLNPDLTAIFSANDQMAIGTIKAIKQIGKSVPNDIAVVGFDNLSVCSLISPALSTINVPTYQMGHLAAQIVLQAFETELNKREYELTANLVIRRSSDITATDEWELGNW